MTAMGKLPAFKSVYEQGIDFRRLDAADTIALHDSNSDVDSIILAFQHALNPTRNKSLQNKANGGHFVLGYRLNGVCRLHS